MNETGAEAPQVEQEQLRREIERTRSELGATVEALSHKADVKAQARAKAEEAKQQARDRVDKLKVQAQESDRPIAPIAAGIGVALVALWLIRRRK